MQKEPVNPHKSWMLQTVLLHSVIMLQRNPQTKETMEDK